MNLLQRTAFKMRLENIEDYRLAIPSTLLFDAYTPFSYVKLIARCQVYYESSNYDNKKEVIAFTKEIGDALFTIRDINYFLKTKSSHQLRLALNQLFKNKQASKRAAMIEFLMVDTRLTESELTQLESLGKCFSIYSAFVNNWDLGTITGIPAATKFQQQMRAYYQY